MLPKHMASVTNEVVKLVFLTVLVACTTWVSASKKSQVVKAQTLWAKTTKSGKDHTTTLQFYFHDTLSGKTPTVVRVAQPANPARYKTSFGKVMMADDPLTLGPDPGSKLVGRAQGLYGSACQDELSLIMALSYSFVDGPYKGSSISIMGRNSIMNSVREIAVVGGTGLFRMARGYALAHTYFFDMKTGDAIVGYNVTLLH